MKMRSFIINMDAVSVSYTHLQVAKGEQLVLQQGLAYDTKNRQIEYTESLMKMERFVYVN